LTSYFAAGRPIAAAVAPESESAIEIATADAGIVVRPDDPKALAEAITLLMKEPEKGALLGDHGREYALTHLTESSALSALESFVERVAATSHTVNVVCPRSDIASILGSSPKRSEFTGAAGLSGGGAGAFID
jgi:hypothetical protein